MLHVYLRIRFSDSISVNDGKKHLIKVLSTGSSKDIVVNSKSQNMLCVFHKELECKIIQFNEDKSVDMEMVFPYCLSGANVGVSELIGSLLYCSVFSFIERYVILDFSLDETSELYKGPEFGIQGIRNKSGVCQYPLLGTILKPRTRIDIARQNDVLKEILETKLVDYIIDDELVVNPLCCSFKERIRNYSDLLKSIKNNNNKNILYWINASADIELAQNIIEYSINLGINTFCLNPISMGFSAVKYIIDKFRGKALFMINNVGRGVITRKSDYYISEKALARLSRLIGADAVYTGPISSNYPYDIQILNEERIALQNDFCGFKPSFAVTSGDIVNCVNITDNIKAIGSNIMVQMGSGILSYDYGDKLNAYKFVADYALNDAIANEIAFAFSQKKHVDSLEGDYYMKTQDPNIKRAKQLNELLQKQLYLRNEYKNALTLTRDPQETTKFNTELDKCEDTIIDFMISLLNLSDVLDNIDEHLCKEVLVITQSRIVEGEEENQIINEIIQTLKSENVVQIVDNETNKKIDNLDINASINNKIELTIPIIPLLLNYKMELSLEVKQRLNNTIKKLLNLVKKEKK